MIKEPFRDYATTAFLYYASVGRPTLDEYEKNIKDEVNKRLAYLPPDVIYLRATAAVNIRKPLCDDIRAINQMFDLLEKNKKDYISHAVRSIYMTNPPKDLSFKKREIQDRVHAYMSTAHLGERTVYRYLKHARQLFAIIRGLTVEYVK
jgi:hypothetical protein